LLREDAYIAFVRTPRRLWPFNSPASGVWPPLGFCSLAASLRRVFPRIRISLLDCPALRVGWKTLEARLQSNPPDVLCIGEETPSASEGMRLAHLAKRINPKGLVIAGGVYFPYAIEEAFATGDFDFIVQGEGENTLMDLVAALLNGESDFGKIAGLVWQKDGMPVVNAPRMPISDLDRLTFPAYDLLEVKAYGRHSRNHPDLATLEHSRGCIGRCTFCILWKHFGRDVAGSMQPHYRTKSPERTVDEVRWLAREHGRRTIHFVDPCFNADPTWNDRFADLMIAARIGVKFTAWMRADCIVRDEGLGVLRKMVRAGLMQVYIGIERLDERDLSTLHKTNNGPDVSRQALGILRRNYPEVFTIGSVIYGLPWESQASLRRLRDFQYDFPLDYALYLPLAPAPGTTIRDELIEQGYRLSDNMDEYNFLTPVMDTDHLTRQQLEDFYSDMLLHVSPARLQSVADALRGNRGSRNRRVYMNLISHALNVSARQLARRLIRPFVRGPTLYSHKPAWYDT
jgi:anaerobic magnesium-protoporphyrin IX monomethyl ester cyclase